MSSSAVLIWPHMFFGVKCPPAPAESIVCMAACCHLSLSPPTVAISCLQLSSSRFCCCYCCCTCLQARALRVRCLGFEGGCQVEGPLAEVEQHEATCPTVLIFCRFRDVGCSTPVLRKEVCTATYVWSLAAARDVVDVAEGVFLVLLLPLCPCS